MFRLSLIFPFFLFSGAVSGNTDCKKTPGDENSFIVSEINIKTNNIFDETAPDAIALHRWANSFHIITKPFIVEERLSFDKGDRVTPEDIVEAEALLRQERYIANAIITPTYNCSDESVSITVETFDNWSLIPTLSFSRSGGENSTLIGVREDNLLGLGIRSTFRYTEDEQRSGYQLGLTSAFPWVRHSTVSLTLADNDDGEVYRLSFNKPFYHLDTKYSLFGSAISSERLEDIFQNDETRNTLLIEETGLIAAYGFQLSGNQDYSSRLTFGITHQESDFEIGLDSPSQDLSFLPQDRQFTYPWASYEYIERDIRVMQDIFLIRQPEDINLGWRFTSLLGIETNSNQGGIGAHIQLSVNKGFLINRGLLLVNASTNAITNTDQKDLVRFDARADYFYRINQSWGYYARLAGTFSSGQFIDRPIVADDDNGVRGYPIQYQHGDNRITSSVEARYYTGYNFYQIFEVGFAGFIDVGRAYGGQFEDLNEDDGILSSIGLGARLYSNKSSNSGVVHLDIALPLGDGESVNSWEWSIQLRRGF